MSLPEYIRISDEIKNLITSQQLNPGENIQSENQLCEIYNVSRMTVRKALTRLVTEGYLEAIPGKGYYVCEPNLDQCSLVFDETFGTMGDTGNIDLIDLDVKKPSREVGIKLEIPKEQPVVMLRRVFRNNELPIACDIKYIPYYRGIPLLEKELKSSTFPEMVAKKNSIFAMTKRIRIFAENANEEIASLLETEVGAALMVIEETLYDQKEKPVGWGLSYILGNHYSLFAEATFH